MRKILITVGSLLMLSACSKEQLASDSKNVELENNSLERADVVYYYKGVVYPLTYEEHSTEHFVENEQYFLLQRATSDRPVVTFTYSDKPENHFYLFENAFEGYDYMEKNGHPLLGRKFKVSLRIDELRARLIAKYGTPLNFDNENIEREAIAGVQAIYRELHINTPFPRDLQEFLGIKGRSFSASGPRNNPVLTVWEHSNFLGQSMNVEDALNTVIWHYGDFNCYTMAANPDLTLEIRPDGNNWNDCISSKCLAYIQGADAMSEGYYKDSHFGVYSCGYALQNTYKQDINASPGPCFSFDQQNYPTGPFCGHMNDQISSIRIKAIWESCSISFADMENL